MDLSLIPSITTRSEAPSVNGLHLTYHTVSMVNEGVNLRIKDASPNTQHSRPAEAFIFKVGWPSIEDARHSRGYGGMPPRKILESRVSEMAFPGFWGEILENS